MLRQSGIRKSVLSFLLTAFLRHLVCLQKQSQRASSSDSLSRATVFKTSPRTYRGLAVIKTVHADHGGAAKTGRVHSQIRD